VASSTRESLGLSRVGSQAASLERLEAFSRAVAAVTSRVSAHVRSPGVPPGVRADLLAKTESFLSRAYAAYHRDLSRVAVPVLWLPPRLRGVDAPKDSTRTSLIT